MIIKDDAGDDEFSIIWQNGYSQTSSVVVAVGKEHLSCDKRWDPEHSEPFSADPFSDILIINSLPHKQAHLRNIITLTGASAQLKSCLENWLYSMCSGSCRGEGSPSEFEAHCAKVPLTLNFVATLRGARPVDIL